MIFTNKQIMILSMHSLNGSYVMGHLKHILTLNVCLKHILTFWSSLNIPTFIFSCPYYQQLSFTTLEWRPMRMFNEIRKRCGTPNRKSVMPRIHSSTTLKKSRTIKFLVERGKPCAIDVWGDGYTWYALYIY